MSSFIKCKIKNGQYKMIFSQKILSRTIVGAVFLIAGASLFAGAKADRCDEYRKCISDNNCNSLTGIGHAAHFCRLACERKHPPENMQECMNRK
jgi:hypothetical protein